VDYVDGDVADVADVADMVDTVDAADAVQGVVVYNLIELYQNVLSVYNRTLYIK
jgi:hypothetical protein